MPMVLNAAIHRKGVMGPGAECSIRAMAISAIVGSATAAVPKVVFRFHLGGASGLIRTRRHVIRRYSKDRL